MTVVLWGARDVLGAALLTAAGAKSVDVRGFERTLVGLGLSRIPSRLRLLLAGGWIATEGVLGLLALTSVAVAAVNVALFVVASSFALVAASANARGVSVKCRCFGGLSGTSFSTAGVIRASVLALVALLVLASHTGAGSLAEAPFVVLECILVAGVAAQASNVLDKTRGPI